MEPVTFSFPSAPTSHCRISIGSGVLNELPGIIKEWKDVDHLYIVYDEAVKELAEVVAQKVPGVHTIPVPSGEASKSLDQVHVIAQKLLEHGATRKSLVIGVGGGMITDLTGFVASIFMRGIRFLFVPTSMLAMTDAAIGGKNGVDLGHVKNMLGTINHPAAVLMDIDVLISLPDPLLKEGLVEAVKKAAILDAAVFAWFEEHMSAVLQKDKQALTQAVTHAVHMKGDVVRNDEREHDQRMMLNFGHTVGHAVEALSHFTLPHGRAVSIGMKCEMDIQHTEGSARVISLLNALELPLEIPEEMDNDALWDLMQNDKKVSDGEVRIAVPERIGTGILRTVTKNEFTAARHG